MGFLLCLGLLSGAAAAYTSHPGITTTRSLDRTEVSPGGEVAVTLTVTVGDIDGDEIVGFYVSDNIPEGLQLLTQEIRLNSGTISPDTETGALGEIYSSSRPRRWVLSEPPTFGGIGLSEGDILEVVYNLEVPIGAPPGTRYVWYNYNWVGLLHFGPDEAVFGFEDLPEPEVLVVGGNRPPDTPVAVFPPDGELWTTPTPNLVWLGSDPDPGDSLTYEVYLGEVDPPPLAASNLDKEMLFPGVLGPDRLYYWQVEATDSHGASTVGPVWNFTTAPDLSDRDRDLVADAMEPDAGCDPMMTDTDGDGLIDGLESILGGTDPAICRSNGQTPDGILDTDGDTIPDAVETANGWAPGDPLDPLSSCPYPLWDDESTCPTEIDCRTNPGPSLTWVNSTGLERWAAEFAGDYNFLSDTMRMPSKGWWKAVPGDNLFKPGGDEWKAIRKLGRQVTVRIVLKSPGGDKCYGAHKTIVITGGPDQLFPDGQEFSWKEAYRNFPGFSWGVGMKVTRLDLSSSPSFPRKKVVSIFGDSMKEGSWAGVRLPRNKWRKISKLGGKIYWRVMARDEGQVRAFSPTAHFFLRGSPVWDTSLEKGTDPPLLSWKKKGNDLTRVILQNYSGSPTIKVLYPKHSFGKKNTWQPKPQKWESLIEGRDVIFMTLKGKRAWHGREVVTFSPFYPIIISR
jgi:hypothetical protein